MPAYRSEAEAEIRAPVVDRLRELLPGCRIIHEINAESFGNRIDVLAVGESRIAAVEIKSAKDKLDRLPTQIQAMRGVTTEVFAALHEKFLSDLRGMTMPPDEARGATVWIYPKMDRIGHINCGPDWSGRAAWQKPMRCLPPSAINLLWREELQALCSSLGVKGVYKLDMRQATDEIRWRMNGEQITRAICKVLRARECVEADTPIHGAANDNHKAEENVA